MFTTTQSKLKEELTYNGDGSLRTKKTYKRDELGHAIETGEYNAQGVLLDQFKNSFDGPLLLTTERKVYREDGSLASVSFYEAEKKRSEATAYKPDGSVANKTVRTAQQLEQYGPDGSLQKTGTISVENRLVDEVVLNKDGSSEKRVECSGSARCARQLDENDEMANRLTRHTTANCRLSHPHLLLINFSHSFEVFSAISA